MAMAEKLEELISQIQYMGGLESRLAEHLIANDVVPVVRCKDCKKGHAELAPNGGVWCALWNHVFNDDGFCCKAERKDND